MSEWETVSKPDDGWETVQSPQGTPEFKPDPTKGNSFLENARIGIGKAFVDLARGVQQLGNRPPTEEEIEKGGFYSAGGFVPFAPGELERRKKAYDEVQADVDESRTLDAPLMNTGGGITGNIAGRIVTTAPALAIPGANTVAGATLVGAVTGAVEPTATGESRVENAVNSALLSGGTQTLFKGAGKVIQARQAAKAAQKAKDAAKNEILRESKDAGYTLPPTQANPRLLNKIFEGISGKIQTAQKASQKNQTTTNSLVKKALGIPEDSPITPEVLNQIRDKAGGAYQAIKDVKLPLRATKAYMDSLKKIGNEWSAAAKEFPELANNEEIKTLVKSLSKNRISPNAAVELIKKLRFDAKSNLKNFADPAKSALGFAQKKAASALEDLIETNLSNTGQKSLVREFKKAREIIAKSHDVEDALNEVTGDVSARYLARLLDKGTPLTGELKTVARFAKAFPKASQDVATIGSQPGFSPLDVAAGGITAAASGNPALLATIAGRPLVRSAILSKPYQYLMAGEPSYSSGMLRLGSALTSSNALRGTAGIGIPAYRLSQD